MLWLWILQIKRIKIEGAQGVLERNMAETGWGGRGMLIAFSTSLAMIYKEIKMQSESWMTRKEDEPLMHKE